MFLKRFISLAMITIVIIAFSSCSDDSSSNPITKDYSYYLPQKTDNWWKWHNYDIDSLGNIIDNNDFDSTVVTRSDTLILSKNALEFKNYDLDGTPNSVQYQYLDGSKIYMHSAAVNEMFSQLSTQFGIALPFNIGTRWFVYADFENNEWTIFDTTYKDIEIPITSTNKVKINLTFNVQGQKGTTKNFTIDSKTYPAQEFKMVISGKYSYLGMEETYNITLHNWIAEYAGVISENMDPITINFFGIKPIKLNGSLSNVINMDVEFYTVE